MCVPLSLIALTALYTTVVTTGLVPDVYPAALVGFTAAIMPTIVGVRLHVQGYSDTEAINRFMKTVVNGEVLLCYTLCTSQCVAKVIYCS